MTNPNFSHEVWKGVAGQGEPGRLGIWAWFRSSCWPDGAVEAATT